MRTRRITALLVMGVVMAVMLVASAGNAFAELSDPVYHGSDQGATVVLRDWKDLPDEFTLSDFFLDECTGSDAQVTAYNDGFYRKVYAPSGEDTWQVHFSREVSFTLDGILYSGTLQNQLSFENLDGTSGQEVTHLSVTGSDGSRIEAIVFDEVIGEQWYLKKAVCPGSGASISP